MKTPASILRQGLLLMAVGLLAACATVSRDAAQLAPTGTLRIGVYPGSPTSLLVDTKTGKRSGISLALGEQLARELGVPAQVVEFQRIAEVVDALEAGTVDITFTNASPERAKRVLFDEALVKLELGLLVPAISTLQSAQPVANVDRDGLRIGVTAGSSSLAALTPQLKNARLVTQPNLAAARAALRKGEIDVFATNKGILFQLNDELKAEGFNARIVEGYWGLENLALAIPPGRQAALPALRAFAKRSQVNGQLGVALRDSGLRGIHPEPK